MAPLSHRGSRATSLHRLGHGERRRSVSPHIRRHDLSHASFAVALGLASGALGCSAGQRNGGPPSAGNPSPVGVGVVAAAVQSTPTSQPSAAPPAPAPSPPPTHPEAAAIPAARRAPSRPTPGPPPPLTPPHPASAQPGDGDWTPLGDPALEERLAATPPVAYVTRLHPHRVSRWKLLTLVAIDQTRVRIQYVPGTNDLRETGVDPATLPRAAGLVPPSDLPALLAIFNSGFQPRHGRWGMMVDRVVLLPPKPEGCTVAVLDDGTVTIGHHAALAARSPSFASLRQAPPCLLEGGELHPRLAAKDQRPWGGRNPDDVTRRRSSVGLDASGRWLFYGMGEELEPSELAAGLRHAGAMSAAQLDINWSWTRFLLVGVCDDAPTITSTLIPQMVYDRGAYLSRPATRDFFYLVRRPPAASPPGG